MNEPIIIDGVDVSECEFYSNFDKTCREENGKYSINICNLSECENIYNCYYKQLQRKTQECEKLLKLYEPLNDEYFNGLDIKTIAGLAKKSIRLTAENIKLEKENEELKIQVSSLRNHISQLLEEKEDEANLSPKP